LVSLAAITPPAEVIIVNTCNIINSVFIFTPLFE
jgi:hypothetical protein